MIRFRPGVVDYILVVTSLPTSALCPSPKTEFPPHIIISVFEKSQDNLVISNLIDECAQWVRCQALISGLINSLIGKTSLRYDAFINLEHASNLFNAYLYLRLEVLNYDTAIIKLILTVCSVQYM